MIRFNLKFAIRNLAKNKIYSILIIAGFALGFAACILIGLFYHTENNVNKNFANHEQIYRLYDVKMNRCNLNWDLYPKLEQDYVDVKDACRDFFSDRSADSKSIIINQAMVKELGLVNPIGKRIANSGNIRTVIGVVENFHFESLRESIRPLSLVLSNSPSIVSVKVNTSDMSKFIQSIKKTWKDFSQNQPIRYTFLDESYARMYTDVQRTGRIFATFSILAIVVACLGLFALSSFMIEQRTKEIGVRKVNGAKTIDITSALSTDFLIWIILSFIIACPIAWYAMQKWLQNFAYKTELSWWVFGIAGVIAVMIAFLTVSWQSFKATKMNPVEALRYE